MGTSFYSGSGLTNQEQDSIESSIAAAEAAQAAAEAAQAAAETAETNAETAEANSETAKVAAEAAQVAAETAESNASSSASSASTDAGTATTKAAEAATSASNASSSASSASTAQTASEAAQTASETAQAAAEAALDEFTDTYLGAKTSDPTLDNDGNALIDGALVFNTTENALKVYDLGTTSWINAYSSNATQSVAGLMSAADKTKLDGVETGATADQTDAEIKTAYENNSDTNAFTDALQTKLNGIETAATADQTDAEIKTAYENNADTNAFTDALQTKLNGIEASADVTDTTNVVAALTAGDNITIAADGTVAASGGEITVQDEGSSLATAATTLNFTGNGVTASGTGAAKTINITDTDTTYSNATTSAAGLMSSSDKTKIDGIEALADVTDTNNVRSALSSATSLELSSATSVEIGTLVTASVKPLMVKSNTDHHAIHIEENSGNEGYSLGVNADGDFGIYNGSTASVVVSDSGKLGIGDTAPDRHLHVNGGTENIVAKFESTDTACAIEFTDSTGTATLETRNDFRFKTGSDIDAQVESGVTKVTRLNVPVTNTSTAGLINLDGSGSLLRFNEGGSYRGQIGETANDIYITSTYTGLRFDWATTHIVPCTNTGGGQDDVDDFGNSSVRWDNIYATNGTIQTSDEREKQQIASLTDAEITAASAISKLFKTYKWNKAVTSKGDGARIHTGVIAQQVETAMSDAGLDASRYAFWCDNTWWQVDNEDGSIQSVYDTEEDAPEEAVKKNRKGIRYPQLLAFIAAATEQRLTNIETRLTALEG